MTVTHCRKSTHVYETWTQDNALHTSSDIYLRHSPDNGMTWGGKVKVSNSGDNFDCVLQVTAIGSNVYVTWNSPASSDVFVRFSPDNGVDWKPIVNISNTAGDSYLPQIAVSGPNTHSRDSITASVSKCSRS